MKGKNASVGEQFPYLKGRNLQWGEIEVDSLETMNFSASERVQYELLPGDLLVSEYGEVGRCAIWEGDVENCYFQNHIYRIRSRGDIPVEYLRYFFEYATSMPGFSRFVTQTSVKQISQSNLRSIPIPYHPETISDSISNLNTLSQLVKAEAASLNKTSLIYTGLLQSIFSNRS